MKKYLTKTLLLCLLLASLLLAACTPAAETDSDSGQAATDTSQTQSSPAEPETTTDTAEGILSAFSTQTLTGENVDNTILTGHPVTMVNVWATFCGPCIQEMPDLAALAAEYQDKGVQILGLVSDVTLADGGFDGEQVDLAKEIVEQTGAGYTHLLPSKDLIRAVLMNVQVVPTTFFVDESGRQLGQTVAGARSADQWREILDGLLAEAGQ